MDKTTVGNLCKPYIGQLKLDDNTLIDYFDIASVDNIEKQITGYTTYKFAEAPSRARKKVEKGNILVSTVRPNLNAVALFDEETENMPVASTGFCVLECKANTSPRFLFRYLQSQSFVRAMVSQATGASYPAVSDKIVRDTKLPAYSYEEQIQIANVLDATANIISKRKHQLQKLNELVKARFVEMFGDPQTNPKGYEKRKLGLLAKKISDGVHAKPEYTETGRPFLSVVNINKGIINFEGCKFVSEEAYQKMIKSTHPERGDVLYTKVGATYGIPAYVDTDTEFCLYVSVCLIKPKHDEIDSRFLALSMSMPYIKRQADSRIKGIGVPDLHLNQISEFDILCPPREEQELFVAFVEQTDKSKVAVQKALDEAQLLFDSLMQKYFE